MLKALLMWSGYILFSIAYGKEGIELKKKYESSIVFPSVLLTLFAWFYLILAVIIIDSNFARPWYEYILLALSTAAYVLFVFFARKWTKKAIADEAQAEAESRKRKLEIEAKEKLAQQEREANQKVQTEALIKAFTEEGGTMQTFLTSASSCAKFSEVLALWDSLNTVKTDVTDGVRAKIYAAVRRERAYGSGPNDIGIFLQGLQKTFNDTLLELQAQADAQKETLVGAAAFQKFIEEAKDGKTFSEMLALWKEVNIENPEIHEEILQKITSSAKAERVYGSSPQEKAEFINGLWEQYGNHLSH